MDLKIEFHNGNRPSESERKVILSLFELMGYGWYAEGSTMEEIHIDRVFDMTFSKVR